MGLRPRIKKAASSPSTSSTDQPEKKVSYEDIEGQVVNLGVLCALLLSLSVGLIISINQELCHRENFGYMMSNDPEVFCPYVLEYLALTPMNNSRSLLIASGTYIDLLSPDMCREFDSVGSVTDYALNGDYFQYISYYSILATHYPKVCMCTYTLSHPYIDINYIHTA